MKNLFNNKEFDIAWYENEGFGYISKFDPVFNDKLIINAAITGIVPTRKDTPYVPLSVEEIILDAEKCLNAGASIIHLHARDDTGAPTNDLNIYKRIIFGIKEKCLDAIICVTTSGRVENTFKSRSTVLQITGDLKPDLASLTLGSMNFPKTASVNSPEMICMLANEMKNRGIKPELEVFETGMINYALYLKKKAILTDKTLYFNLLFGSLGTIPARISDLEHLLLTLPEFCVWGAAGIGRFQLPINIISIIKGGHVRVGLEDNIYFDCHKQQLATNENLIVRLVNFSKSIGREVASPKETRLMLGI